MNCVIRGFERAMRLDIGSINNSIGVHELVEGSHRNILPALVNDVVRLYASNI